MHRNPSVMRHTFSEVPQAEIPRSTFSRSHSHKTTINAGILYPIYVDEALPGDTARVQMTGFARLATPIFPIIDNMMMDVHFFAVPIRLIWDNWQKFNGEQENPGDSTDFLTPLVDGAASPTGFASGSLEDYMGIPPGVPVRPVAFWHRAYNLIWNQWYRDINLQDSVPVHKGDGPDPASSYTLLRRGKRHDYFTSCLPWPQKGPGVSIPLGGQAPVLGIGTEGNLFAGPPQGVFESDGTTSVYDKFQWVNITAGARQMIREDPANPGYPGIYADLTAATAATINTLRQAFQIQKIYERDARGGTRYVELLRAHFGVTSPDHRMQRAEFLGGGSTPVNISPIPQTGATDATSPQGNLAAMGTALLKGAGFTASFTEHCVVVGLLSVRADLTYQQGVNRMFGRRTRFDFYWPALAHIGEQPVYTKEIYLHNTVQEGDVFGYQERHAEYRYKPSIITGKLRSSHPQSLDAWHLAQDFASTPVLNDSFIQENPPVDRVIAVPSEPHFIFDSFFNMSWARPMPVYGVPGLIDHF